MHGWIASLKKFSKDLCIVLHTDKTCTNLIWKPTASPSLFKNNIFSTNLTEEEIIQGDTDNKLSGCIDWLMEKKSPKAILVLEGCISKLINTDVTKNVEDAKNKHSIPIHHVNAAGLKFENPVNIMDRAGTFLLSLGEKTERKKRSINIFGFDNYGMKSVDSGAISNGLEEINKVLNRLGITINAVLNPRSTLDDWKRAKNADLNVAFDERIYGEVRDVLKGHGIPSIVTKYPIGFAPTKTFFHDICDALEESSPKTTHLLEEIMREPREIFAERAVKFRNKKVVYNIATTLDFSITTFIREGLTALDFFREMNCDIEILVQGNPEEAHRKEVEEILRSNNITEPFTMFGHCGDAYTFLKKMPRDTLVFGSGAIESQARDEGLAFVRSNELSIGFGELAKNFDTLEQNE